MRKGHEVPKAVPLGFFGLESRVIPGPMVFFDFDLVAHGQLAQSVGVGELIVGHEETHGVAGHPAPKAFVDALGGGHRKGGGFFVVKRTEP